MCDAGISMTKDSPPEIDPMLGQVALCLASGGWVGFAPIAPGTFGALLGIPLAWLIAAIAHLTGEWWVATQIVITVLVIVAGFPICTWAERYLGRGSDPGVIVYDEFSTVALVFIGLPPALLYSPLVLALGFALHRLFDITKPPPIYQLQSLPEGYGVMVDDIVAGILALGCLWGCLAMGWVA